MRTIEDELYAYARGINPKGKHYMKLGKSGKVILKENKNTTKVQDFLDDYRIHRERMFRKKLFKVVFKFKDSGLISHVENGFESKEQAHRYLQAIYPKNGKCYVF